ncbi:1,3-beta-glucanosyltransferase [Exophiala xenobiotica]|uniref:1,3-beta-glucanosyltransferase n=1 Tax=Vermiconidia calcicola TaxID=1690605 RepID=A0AAV9QIV9_9PEZI|nr:1,3-beta-glucanosyltransferase [Exophiala xenobiotica]KAK5545076.1 1,3-beta-glucanosyltransferase [Vermiconidia calcicola]KAK5549280.1 1,3-beta-glucanosyltransferase [Chaetothyriales sp. CCFEE 6169]KAK5268432.1 1,3-beta-glucanosyltransferase [Exophiala xenobiotica]KAK5305096.1 1,3-beta-glucanosyltransferase [Exophiala xenobiotica]
MRSSALAAVALSAGVASAASVKRASSVTPITVKGNAFFAGNDRFYIRGVDYQPGGSSDVADPIADSAGCTRDIAEFQKLGLNTIRVYTVDNTADHDACMSALADAGIYLVLDVNTPKYSLNRADPNPSYNDVYLQSIFATIDAFQKYDNTLAFFSGNEVINDPETSAAAPYVKAVTRDMRQYIRNRSYRTIPVGYSAADVSENRLEMAEYMNCGTDDERSDFFAFNDYSWCDPSSFTQSGWDQKVKNFTGYGLPLFLSEYGCNTNTREFEEVTALYNSEMTGVYSGGLVYEYSQEASNYGLVEISGDSVSELPDFAALQSQFAKTANPTGDGGYNSTGGASGCPTYSSPNWLVKDDSLPAIPAGAKKYMSQGAGTGPGLSGAGSQNAGGASTGTATAGSGQASQTGSSGSGSTSTSGAVAMTVPEWSLAPLVCGAVVVMSTFFGAALL